MVTGFNTDVEFNGRVYHVQTEDRGLEHPVLESLVYTGGEIVTSRKNSYEDLLVDGQDPAESIQTRMETQHRDLIREIRNGAFASGALKPFGHGIVTNRSFDEVVAEFLSREPAVLRPPEARPAPAPPDEGGSSPAAASVPAASTAAATAVAEPDPSEGPAASSPRRRSAAKPKRSVKRS